MKKYADIDIKVFIINESEKNILIHQIIKFFNELFKKHTNINVYMSELQEQHSMNFGPNIMCSLAETKFRNNMNLLNYTHDKYNSNAEIDVKFNQMISDKTTYEIFQKSNVIYFNFLHRNNEDFFDLIIIFTKTMKNFK